MNTDQPLSRPTNYKKQRTLFIVLLACISLLVISVPWIVFSDLLTPLATLIFVLSATGALGIAAFLNLCLHSKHKALLTPVNPEDHSRSLRSDSFRVLYDVASNINAAKDLNDLLKRFVHILKDIVNANAAAVRLLREDGTMELVASTGLDPAVVEAERNMPADCSICGSVIQKGEIRVLNDMAPCQQSIGHGFLANDDNIEHIAVPLRFQDKIVGVYNLFVNKDDLEIKEDTNDLLTIIGSQLGTAVEKANLEEKARRVLVMHERNMIANELHDSLAQTLASLRFQVRVLDETLQQSGEYQSIHSIEQVEHSLDEAYTDLRELIAHCRTPISEQGVVNSIEKLISRFRKETDIHVLFQKEWHDARLPANMEMHIYRIVQEALTNIRKHSDANNVRVLLSNTKSGDYKVLVENDGRGFEQPPQRNHAGEHIGLTIMQERARHVGGELDIETDPEEGTRIELNFHYNDEPVVDIQPANSTSVNTQITGTHN